MRRIVCPERDDWRQTAEQCGFAFHTIDGERYWDESAYYAFTLDEIERIEELQIADVRRRLEDRRLALELTEDARLLIARLGYDPVYGARPLRRFIQREVETRIARA